MKETKLIKTFLISLFCTIALTTSNIYFEKVTAEPIQNTLIEAQDTNTIVNALDIVSNPTAFLNKTVTINAKFDKFATLGLDYKPAYKSSEEYISFLIKRDDTGFDIPLSEMKLFLKRDLAEKNIELKTNDEISITGIVFSDALGDAWVDVNNITITKKAPEKNGV